jgi:hypothetical protein
LARPARLIRSTVSSSNGTDSPIERPQGLGDFRLKVSCLWHSIGEFTEKWRASRATAWRP